LTIAIALTQHDSYDIFLKTVINSNRRLYRTVTVLVIATYSFVCGFLKMIAVCNYRGVVKVSHRDDDRWAADGCEDFRDHRRAARRVNNLLYLLVVCVA